MRRYTSHDTAIGSESDLTERKFMKPVIAIASIFLSASFAFSATAKQPSRELEQITRALISNPNIVQQLNKNNSPHLSEYKIQAIGQGKYKYDLVFTRKCHCIPSTANVSILEDMTPTYADGAPKYKATIKVKSGF